MMRSTFLVVFAVLASTAVASDRRLQQDYHYVHADGTPVHSADADKSHLFGPMPPNVVDSPPSAIECGEGLGEISFTDIQNALVPCIFGVVKSCCDGLAPIFRIGEMKNSPLEGCLCNELILTETVREVENTQITELVGFTGSRFMTVLQGCSINFFFGEGNATCPGIIPASLVGDLGGGDDDDDDDDGPPHHVQHPPYQPAHPPGLLGFFKHRFLG